MTQLSSVECVGLTVAIIVVILLSYDWYHAHSAELMHVKKGGAPDPKHGFTEKDLEKFLGTETVTPADYDPAAVGLEQSVLDSHKQFTDEAYAYAHGANATDIIRDDPNEVNRRWGLRRVDYDTAVSGADARVVSSEDPHQVHQAHDSFVL